MKGNDVFMDQILALFSLFISVVIVSNQLQKKHLNFPAIERGNLIMNGIQIRRAQKADLQRMQKVAQRTIDKCYRSFLGDEGVDWFLNSGESDRELEKGIENCDVLLDAGVIVGFSIYFDDLVHLMMVDVAHHRGGLGTLLLGHCEDQLFARGNNTIRLETFDGNIQAINFYKKNGRKQVRKMKDEEHGFVRIFFEKETAC